MSWWTRIVFLGLFFTSPAIHAQIDLTGFIARDYFQVIFPIPLEGILTAPEDQEYLDVYEVIRDKDWDGARLVLDKAEKLGSDPWYTYYYAYLQFALGEYKVASSILMNAELASEHPGSQFILAWSYLRLNLPEKTGEMINRIRKSEPDSQVLDYTRAAYEHAFNRNTTAIKYLTSLNEKDYFTYINLSLLHFQLLDYEEAYQVAGIGLEHFPGNEKLRALKLIFGLLVDAEGYRYQEDADMLIESSRENGNYSLVRGLINIANGYDELGLDDIKNGIGRGESTDSYSNLAINIRPSKLFNLVLDKYYELRPYMTVVDRDLVVDFLISHFLGEGSSINQNLEDISSSSDKLMPYYLQLLKPGSDASKLPICDTIISRDSSAYEIYWLRARGLSGSGNPEKALEDMNYYIKNVPYNTDALKFRAGLYMAQDNFTKAYVDYSKCIAIDSLDMESYNSRGACAVSMGYYKEAIADLERVEKKDPSNLDALSMLYISNLMVKDTLNAINYLEKAVLMKIYTPKILEELGRWYIL